MHGSRNIKLVECVDKGRSTNTVCQKALTQHQLSNDVSKQKYRKEQDKSGSALQRKQKKNNKERGSTDTCHIT
jgi:hypothetical protein